MEKLLVLADEAVS